MRVIGMIGGTSSQSTIEYYRLANEFVGQRLGGLHSARIQLASVDFGELQPLQAAGKWDEAAAFYVELAHGLVAGGADMIVICANTMHVVADQVQSAVSIPVVHLADVTADAVKAAGLERVGLLGTAYTMEQPFLRDRLESHGLDVVIPEAADRAELHRLIYSEFALGIFTDEARVTVQGMIDRLGDLGCTGVILGCTEIEMLISAADSSLPVFPTMWLHVAAAVELALAES